MGLVERVKKYVILEESDSLANKDLIPMPPSRRLWTWRGYAGYWSMNGLCLSSWSAASSLLSLGLNVSHTMGIIVIANLLISAVAVINGQSGSDFHIGYSMTQRAIFGNRLGAIIPICVRIILSIVWFASTLWLGGLCLNCVLASLSHHYLHLPNTFPDSVNMTSQELIGFVLYLIICSFLILVKPEHLGKHLVICSFVTFFVSLGIVSWAVTFAGGNGPLMHSKIELSSSATGWAWMYGISSFYGSLTAGIANQNDYTRFAKTRKSQVISTIICLNISDLIIPLMGIITASALYGVYAEEYWMPNVIIMQWMQDDYSPKARAGAFFAGLAFTYSQIVYNVMGNAFAGGMDFSGLFPRIINIRRGAYITLILCWVIQPWLIYNTSSTFVTVMSSFSVFVSPLIAIMICDYWVVRKRKYKLKDLYSSDPSGCYYYYKQFNLRAIVAWVLGFVWGVPGLASSANPNIPMSDGWMHFYDGNSIFGFAISFFLYFVFSKIWPIQDAGVLDDYDYCNTFTPEECEALGIKPFNVQLLEEEPEELKVAVVSSNPNLLKSLDSENTI